MKQNLKYFTKLKVIQALSFLGIPLMLMCAHNEILPSISHYAHAKPMLFAVLLTMAACLFLYDGYVEPKRRYNLIPAIGLFGLTLFPNITWDNTHYTFTVMFFIGSLFNMVYFSSREERWWKILTALLVLFGMAGCFIFDWYSIFWAEWIGMIPISIHFVLEAQGKID